MMNFCTLFDSYYIHKGIALYLSLEKVTDDFHLYVMAFDDDSYNKLNSLHFAHMTVVNWSIFEKDRILEIKNERTRAEYCWSCGPSVIHYFLTNYKLPSITYLDSDLYFVGNPQIAFDEIGDKSVAITEQGVSEKSAKLYGKYCVQFMYFKNDVDGLAALTWWRDSCLDWCYQRFEGDKYGDQKYLDQFPVKFKNVHIMTNYGVGIAPWNMHKYAFTGNTLEYEGNSYPCVFFHMHGIVCEFKGNMLILRSYDFPFNKTTKETFFDKYAELTRKLLNEFFAKNLESSKSVGQSWIKQIEYSVRTLLRNFGLVQWIYFRFFKKTYKGHGLKLD